MSIANTRASIIERHYQQYLQHEDAATFIRAIASRFTLGTLERLCTSRSPQCRRAAALAIGFLGGYQCNQTLGRALHDSDRGVRLIAENGIRALWQRAGNDRHTLALAEISRLNNSRQFDEVVERATWLIDEDPILAEAWNQRAIAFFHLGRFEDSIRDCHQALEINPYHFPAAVGMGHCYLDLNDPEQALECFQRALGLNPDLAGVRAQVDFLVRLIDEN